MIYLIKLEGLNYKEALRYMGCHNGKADENTMALLEECEQLVISHSVPRYRYEIFNISHTDKGIAVLGTKLFLTGMDIKQHLENCYSLVLMCATLSGKIDALIRKTQLEDMAKAVIVNSMSSVAIEQLCDKVENEIHSKAHDCYKTRRYSPGYGDLPIDLQKDILTTLDAPRKIGLCTTNSMTLTPIKSVTAIIGLSHSPILPKKRGCAGCNLKDVCQYRKAGNYCVK